LRTLAQPRARSVTDRRHDAQVAVGRTERLEVLRPRLVATFGRSAATLRLVGDALALLEMAWHDCYGEVTPPDDVIDDVLLCSQGTLDGLIAAAHLAVVDRRDLSVWAKSLR
jgi:hypothetical protein